jgi:hypothetical protein
VHNQGRRLVNHKPVSRLVDHRKIHHNLQTHPTKSHHARETRNPLLHPIVTFMKQPYAIYKKRVACHSSKQPLS